MKSLLLVTLMVDCVFADKVKQRRGIEMKDPNQKIDWGKISAGKIETCVSDFMAPYLKMCSRERSYDIVHKLFQEFIKNPPKNEVAREKKIDYLARNLFMFLASWGMLRNSFLLYANYRCLIGTCKIICNQYGKYLDIDPYEAEFPKEEFIKDIPVLCKIIKEKLGTFASNFNTNSKGVSTTLVSKILLVTLGCIPAYDEQAKLALCDMNINSCSNSISEDALRELLCFVEHYESDFRECRKTHQGETEVKYSIMKYVDMVLWKLGEPLVEKEKEKERENRRKREEGK